jgi:hypothetical protein
MMNFNFRFGAEMKASIERPLVICASSEDQSSPPPKPFDPTGPTNEEILDMMKS